MKYSVIVGSIEFLFLGFVLVLLYQGKEEKGQWKLWGKINNNWKSKIYSIIILTILFIGSSKAIIIQQRIELAGGLFM